MHCQTSSSPDLHHSESSKGWKSEGVADGVSNMEGLVSWLQTLAFSELGSPACCDMSGANSSCCRGLVAAARAVEGEAVARVPFSAVLTAETAFRRLLALERRRIGDVRCFARQQRALGFFP